MRFAITLRTSRFRFLPPVKFTRHSSLACLVEAKRRRVTRHCVPSALALRQVREPSRVFALPEQCARFTFTPPEVRERSRAFTSAKQRERNAFTLVELLVVIGVISLLLVALMPALGPATGRSLDNSTRLFLADLESARLMAIAERTRTRVLIPVAAAPALGQDLALRSYTITSFNRTANNWKQRGKWNRLAQSVAFDPDPSLTDAATQMSVLRDRQTETTTLDTTTIFTGPYIEFRANGGTSLDPNGNSKWWFWQMQLLILTERSQRRTEACDRKSRSIP